MEREEGSRAGGAVHTHAVRFLMRLRWLLLPSQAKPILLQLLRRIACLGHRNDFHIPQQLKPLSQGENPIKFGSERNKSELSVK